MHSFAWWPTVIVLSVATFTDLRSRRIPNWLVFPFLAGGDCGFELAPWLARRRAEPGGRRVGDFDLRISFLDGRDGRRRREAVRRDRSVDWPGPVVYRAGVDRPGGGSDGAHLGGLRGGFLKELFQHTGDLAFQCEGARGGGSEQPAAAQDAVCACHRDRDVDFVFCALRNGGKKCPVCKITRL